MNLKVLLPTEILLDETVDQVSAEAENGSFVLLPNHIDFVAPLVPGILSFVAGGTGETFVAVDEGTLVKCGDEVLVSVRQGVRGTDLHSLEDTVEREFRQLGDRERQARSAVAKLEAGFIRGFVETGGGQ